MSLYDWGWKKKTLDLTPFLLKNSFDKCDDNNDNNDQINSELFFLTKSGRRCFYKEMLNKTTVSWYSLKVQ